MSQFDISLSRALSPYQEFWLRILLRYLLVAAGGNLVWETLHLPLYTLWRDGTVGELVFAVLHCTGGDLLIAFSSLVLALVLIGKGAWPKRKYQAVDSGLAGEGGETIRIAALPHEART